MLVEAANHLSTSATRDTMAYIIMYNNPNNLVQLFENHFESLSDDFMFIAQQNDLYISQEQRLIITIISTEKAIQKISGDESITSRFGLPALTETEQESGNDILAQIDILICNENNPQSNSFSYQEMRERNIIDNVANYNNTSEEQKHFIDTVLDCINTRTQFLGFLNAFAGT